MISKVAVIGLGYVGLPLSVVIASKGYKVVGFDSNEIKVSAINKGISPIEDLESNQLQSQVEAGNFVATTRFEDLAESDVYLICVPTPLLSEFKPDLSYVEKAAKTISRTLKPGALVILESTVEPGTSRNFLLPILERESGINSDEFYLVFSPERIDPSNKNWNIKTTPKIVAGFTQESSGLAVSFYSTFIDRVVVCDSLEAAELAKLLENTFRFINISFINEFSITCRKLGVDVNQVIEAAATKPYGFMPFYPSIGVGGHCIPVDPLYLSNRSASVGAPTRFIDLANSVNQETPLYFADLAREKLGVLTGKKILVIGISYKPNIADTRESPALKLIDKLKSLGAHVSWHDDLVRELREEKSVPISDQFDLAILATLHGYVDLTKLGKVPILDTRGSI